MVEGDAPLSGWPLIRVLQPEAGKFRVVLPGGREFPPAGSNFAGFTGRVWASI